MTTLEKLKELEKLEINLFPDSTNESAYNRAKAQYIAKAESYRPGGFLTPG